MISAMVRKPWSLACGARGVFGFREHRRIRFLHHLFAKVHANQVVLEDVVVEHILGRLAQIDDPFRHGRRGNAERHVLRIGGAGGVIIAADSADPAGDEMSVARILALHEYAVAAEDGGRAVTLGDFSVLEINLRENAEAAHDPGNRIPVHLDQVSRLAGRLRSWFGNRFLGPWLIPLPIQKQSLVRIGSIASGQLSPLGCRHFVFFVDGRIGE